MSRSPQRRTIELVEYEPIELPADALAYDDGVELWERFGSQIGVDFPSPRTGGRWRLGSNGWVGAIRLGTNVSIKLRPRVPVAHVFGMLEYAHRLKSFRLLDGTQRMGSVTAFSSALAGLLGSRVLERARRGFHREYVERRSPLPYLRGRIDIARESVSADPTMIDCRYQERSIDIEENRILYRTLETIVASTLCSDFVLPTVRRAARTLHGAVSLVEIDAARCRDRHYTRLTEDYRQMHALCAYFLEHIVPSPTGETRTAIPFLVDMARLFELFVAEWLRSHLPLAIDVVAQERLPIAPSLHFQPDLLLRDRESGRTIHVIDTKYKPATAADPADVSQVVAYATATGARSAILLYPTPLSNELDTYIGEIRVRTLAFDIGNDLELGGQEMLRRLKLETGAW